MNTPDAAFYLGISEYYLRNMRHLMHKHEGPEYTVEKVKNRTMCLYTKEALDKWDQQHRRKEKT